MKRMRQLSGAFILATLTACGRDPGPREATKVNGAVSGNVPVHASVSEAPKASQLVFPSRTLKSAEVQSSRQGGEWKTVDPETACKLVSALSENHRYCQPERFICVLLVPPKWSFRFTWSDGTSTLVHLTADGGMIRRSEMERGGVKQDVDYGSYVVESKHMKEILERCPSVEEFTKETCAVCGILVLSNSPFSKGRGARCFYFCSEEHIDRFEQSPETFENGPKSPQGEEHR